MNEAAAPVSCLLCQSAIKKPRRAPVIYGRMVCKKCRNAFANRRQAAFIIDWIIWTAFSIPVFLGLNYVFFGSINPPPANLLLDFLGLSNGVDFFITWVWQLLFFCKDGFNGASLGKRLMGVQVVDSVTREPIGFGQSLKRNLVLLIPFAVLIVAGRLLKGPRWGDGWAKTNVIWKKYLYHPVFDPRGFLCTNCGYDLTGNTSGRCPECFAPVPSSAAPPATFEPAAP